MNTAITSESIAFAKKLKKILENNSIQSCSKYSAFLKAYKNGEINYGSKYKYDFWLQFLDFLRDDYFDALNHNYSFVDGYSIEDLRKLLDVVINDLLYQKMPKLDINNYYYRIAMMGIVDDIFCENKNKLDYLTNSISKILDNLGVKNYEINNSEKWNRIIINKKLGQSIKINKTRIYVIFKKELFFYPLYDIIFLNTVVNEKTLFLKIEAILKFRKLLVC